MHPMTTEKLTAQARVSTSRGKTATALPIFRPVLSRVKLLVNNANVCPSQQ